MRFELKGCIVKDRPRRQHANPSPQGGDHEPDDREPDEVPETPPDEPAPEPVKDPPPDEAPRIPYVVIG